jgi:hypothetical protein
MKKIGLLCLALVLALGALGVGYAAWIDTITIEGTVNTGSVDINVEYYSGTDIYKDLDPAANGAMVTVRWVKDAAGATVWSNGNPPKDGLLVAWAKAEPGLADDTVVVTYNNTFPTSSLVADIIVHYVGSVPAMVTANITSADQWLIDLWNDGDAGAKGALVDMENGFEFIAPIEELPIQMHYCDYAKIWLWMDLPQDDALMNLSGNFTAHITAIQWNEVGELL